MVADCMKSVASSVAEDCLHRQLKQLLPDCGNVCAAGMRASDSIGTAFDTVVTLGGSAVPADIHFTLLFRSDEVKRAASCAGNVLDVDDLMRELANQFVGSVRGRLGARANAVHNPLPSIDFLGDTGVSALINRWVEDDALAHSTDTLFEHRWASVLADKSFRFSARLRLAGRPLDISLAISRLAESQGDDGVISYLEIDD